MDHTTFLPFCVQVLASWYHFFRRLASVIWRFAIPALSWMLALWSSCGKILVKTVLLGCMLSSAVNSAAEVLCFLVIIFFNIHRPLSVHFGFCGLFLFADNFFLYFVCTVINVGTTHSANFGPQHLHGSHSVNLHQTVLHCKGVDIILSNSCTFINAASFEKVLKADNILALYIWITMADRTKNSSLLCVPVISISRLPTFGNRVT